MNKEETKITPSGQAVDLPRLVLSMLDLSLQGVKLYCDTCKEPTSHEFADPDIQCKKCHWVTASIH